MVCLKIESEAPINIRDINPNSDFEIQLVAARMRQTLIEVLGEERGGAMYSMEWLIQRVRWHLDSGNTTGRVFVYEAQGREIIGHAIARIDHGSSFGYFSTVFVEPSSRRHGVASNLIKHVENWFSECEMPQIKYNTAHNHIALISLFKAHGYEATHSEAEMVQLTKNLKKI